MRTVLSENRLNPLFLSLKLSNNKYLMMYCLKDVFCRSYTCLVNK